MSGLDVAFPSRTAAVQLEAKTAELLGLSFADQRKTLDFGVMQTDSHGEARLCGNLAGSPARRRQTQGHWVYV
jgi:hypothetical protein